MEAPRDALAKMAKRLRVISRENHDRLHITVRNQLLRQEIEDQKSKWEATK